MSSYLALRLMLAFASWRTLITDSDYQVGCRVLAVSIDESSTDDERAALPNTGRNTLTAATLIAGPGRARAAHPARASRD